MNEPAPKRLDRLEELQALLKSPLDPHELAERLPEAVDIARNANVHLEEKLQPILEASLLKSVEANPRRIVDILFPVILPAIRRAVIAALNSLVEEINGVLERSFSMEAMKWRVEALRSGRPVSEIALLHSLRPKIEDVLLVHRQTGVLLARASSNPEAAFDSDVTSSILMAIQDFLQETFEVSGEQELTKLEIGSHVMWIEQGPWAILAARVEGALPQGFRELLTDTLSTIHETGLDDLKNFHGNVAPFARFQDDLDRCLHFQPPRARRRSFRAIAWAIVGVPLLILLLFAGVTWMRAHREQKLRASAAEIPGVAATATYRERGKLILDLSLDTSSPLAMAQVRELQRRDPRVELRLSPVLSLDPRIVAEKANLLLAPPPGVRVGFAEGTLRLTGLAPYAWVQRARGSFRQVPGVLRLDDSGLKSVEATELEGEARRIEGMAVYFPPGKFLLTPRARKDARALATALRDLEAKAAEIALSPEFTTVASVDWETGSAQTNGRLIHDRAGALSAALRREGIRVKEVDGELPVSSNAEPSLARRASVRVLVRPVTAGE